MNQKYKFDLCKYCKNRMINSKCNDCDGNVNFENFEGYLPIQTLIKGKYLVGKLLSVNSEGATYLCYDVEQNEKYLIREYVPLNLSKGRDNDKVTLIVDMSKKAQYKALMVDFIDLSKILFDIRNIKGIIPIVDIFTQNNTAYVVRKYVQAKSLNIYIREHGGYISWYKCKNIFLSINAILSKIHRQGVIHRGINLDNVLLDEQGNVYLDGFCIACVRTANSELEQELFDGYSAPEQYQTDGWQGTWTDVYAVAATLYTVLTGQILPGFELRVNDEYLILEKFGTMMPRDIAETIIKAIKIHHRDRTQTVDQFNVELMGEENSTTTAIYDTTKLLDKKIGGETMNKKKRNIILGVVIVSALLIVVAIISGVNFIRNIKNGSHKVEKIDEQYIEKNSWLFDENDEEVKNVVGDSGESLLKRDENEILLFLPNFVGEQIQSVKKNSQYIERFNIIEEQEYSESKKGEIIQQDPLPGVSIKNKKIDLILKVSKGLEYAEVPDIVGKKISDAENTLKELGIEYDLVEVYNKNFQKDIINSMDRKVGEKIIKNKEKLILRVKSSQLKDNNLNQKDSSSQENDNITNSSNISTNSNYSIKEE